MVVRAPETDDELRECNRIGARAFNGTLSAEADGEWLGRAHRDRILAVFVGDSMAAWSQVRPFGAFFGGRSVPMGGFSPVATAPEHRGHGYGSLVTAAQFPSMRDRGELISGLFPASTQLYRRNGFELGGVYTFRTLPSRSLHSLRPSNAVPVRRAVEEDVAAIKGCYRRFAATQPGWLDRPEVWWTQRVLPPEKFEEQHLYVVDADDGSGEIAGYVHYVHRPAKPFGYTIVVQDLCAEDPDVAVALWKLIGSSSTQVEEVQVAGAAEHALLLMLADQDLKTTVEIRWMLRVVDAVGAVAARGFPPAIRATIDLEVVDRQCDWNAGRWRLEVEDGRGVLARGGDGDVTLTVNALSALYSGYASATTLRQTGSITSGSSRSLSDLTAAFSGPTPSIADFY